MGFAQPGRRVVAAFWTEARPKVSLAEGMAGATLQPMETLLISRSQAMELLNIEALVPVLRDAFVQYSRDSSIRPLRIRTDLPGPGTATVLFPGLITGVPVYSVKVHAKYPEQAPAIRGVLCLHSTETGDLLAVMDSTYLTAVRTGLAGALAADVLARPDADIAAVVGAGVQGRYQLSSLALLRPVRRVRVYDIVPEVAERFSSEMSKELDLPVEPATSVRDALHGAGIVLAATWARTPLIEPDMLDDGAHLTTLGADEPGKAEVSAGVIRGARFFCDDADLAVEMGALGGVGLSRDFVAAELGDVLAHVHPGRTSAEQITVYGGVGVAFQDVACAWAIYQEAKKRGVGQHFDFLG